MARRGDRPTERSGWHDLGEGPPLDDPISIALLLMAAYPLIKDGILALRARLSAKSVSPADRVMAASLYTDLARLEFNADTLRFFLMRKGLNLHASMSPGSFSATLTREERNVYESLFNDCLSGVRLAFEHATVIVGSLEAGAKPTPDVDTLEDAIREFNRLRVAENYLQFFEGVATLSALLRTSLSDLGLGGGATLPKTPPDYPVDPEETRREIHRLLRDALKRPD
jgi:hypothetical protein